MDTYIAAIEVNPFGIDCMDCDKRYAIEDMTLNENSKVLCQECLMDHRVEKLIDFSKKMFN